MLIITRKKIRQAKKAKKRVREREKKKKKKKKRHGGEEKKWENKIYGVGRGRAWWKGGGEGVGTEQGRYKERLTKRTTRDHG